MRGTCPLAPPSPAFLQLAKLEVKRETVHKAQENTTLKNARSDQMPTQSLEILSIFSHELQSVLNKKCRSRFRLLLTQRGGPWDLRVAGLANFSARALGFTREHPLGLNRPDFRVLRFVTGCGFGHFYDQVSGISLKIPILSAFRMLKTRWQESVKTKMLEIIKDY